MQQEDHLTNCTNNNPSPTMAQSNFTPALMGQQLAPNNNDNRSNHGKDASNGALSKSGRTPRPTAGNAGSGGGKRRRNQRQQRHQPSSYDVTNPRGGNKKTLASPIAKADEFEAGSVFHSGPKKQNLNHLLNFQFEPRGDRRNANRFRNGKITRAHETVRTKYIKEQYLQANCQFAVRNGPDYSHHLTDPDLLVDWSLIEQVVLKTTAKVPSCPICLSPPVAAKITRCGHVYCWTCMLHYLSLSDDDYRKCPICFEDIWSKDLKSVVSFPWREIKIGEEIEMTLMRRERNSLFAMPVDDYFPEVNGKHPNIGQPNGYSQLATADPIQVSKMILDREQQELLGLLTELDGDPTVCYVQQALTLLAERESGLALNTITVDQAISRSDVQKNNDQQVAIDDCEDQDARPRQESSSSNGNDEVVVDEGGVTAKDLDFCQPKVGTKSKAKTPKETFYFYQSSDIQPIFLHALNVEMLIEQHGTFENCPKKIRGKILEKDSASMTLEMRNKLRYLTHVPVTCAFEVVEIELNDISKDVRAKFDSQLDDRRLKRIKRARDERRREKRIQIEESKLLGRYSGAEKNLRIESDFHFPGIAEPTTNRRVSESSGFSVDSGQSPPQDSSGASFARMLREGKPQMPRLVRSETFPVQTLPRVRQTSESEPEDYVPPPPTQTIGDALASALQRATISEESATQSGKKKGKKAKGSFKKIDLFSSARPTL